MKNYKYVGNGMGVPGLPHLVSDDKAAELGVLHILNEAIENGSYVEVTPSALGFDTPQRTKARLLNQQDLQRTDKNKGVNNG